jgi:hypothetical protein
MAFPAFLHRAMKVAHALALRGQITISQQGDVDIPCRCAMTARMQIPVFGEGYVNTSLKLGD